MPVEPFPGQLHLGSKHLGLGFRQAGHKIGDGVGCHHLCGVAVAGEVGQEGPQPGAKVRRAGFDQGIGLIPLLLLEMLEQRRPLLASPLRERLQLRLRSQLPLKAHHRVASHAPGTDLTPARH